MTAVPSLAIPATSRQGIKIYRDLETLGLVRREWKLLQEAGGGGCSSCSYEFVTSWWEAYEPEIRRKFGEAQLEVLLFWGSEDELLGIVPAYRLPRSVWRGIPAQLVSIGRWPDAGTETMCEEPTILLRGGALELVLDEVARHLAREMSAGKLDMANLIWSPGENTQHSFQEKLRKAAGEEILLRFRSKPPCIHIQLTDQWSDHRQRMSKSMRDNMGYYPRLLDRHGHCWRVRIISDQAQVDSSVRKLGVLHRDRSSHRRLKIHRVHITGKVQEEFLAGFVSASLPKEEAFIAELVVGEEVIASQAFFVSGKALTVHYSGFSAEWSQYSPMFVLEAYVFKEMHRRGIRTINFMTGSAHWQFRWGPHKEEPMVVSYLLGTRPLSVILSWWFLAVSKATYLLSSRAALSKAARHERARNRLKAKLSRATKG